MHAPTQQEIPDSQENWRQHGTGALNIDACRIEAADGVPKFTHRGEDSANVYGDGKNGSNRTGEVDTATGRWPANLILDGSPEIVGHFPTEAGAAAPVTVRNGDKFRNSYGAFAGNRDEQGSTFHGDAGSAARFFASFPREDECPSQPSGAPTAAPSLSLQSALAASVQSVAAILPSLAGIVSSDSTAPSTSVTPSESRTTYELATAAITNIASGCSREQRHEKLTPSGSRVSVAATREPTGTTTITASLSKSDGSVERVTFTITPTSVDRGEAVSRFRYCAKATREDRNEGCEHFPRKALNWSSGTQNPGSFQAEGTDRTSPNHHPTVKPTDLMRWLVRLVTPAGGLVLDPFMGSGSTGKAAMLEGLRFTGIDLTPEYVEIARARIEFALRQGHQPSLLELA